MVEESIKRVADSSLQYIEEKSWAGACFAMSAINSILLQELGVDARPCLGVLSVSVIDDFGRSNNVAFDHAWVSHGPNIIDVAITKGLNVNFGRELLPSSGFRVRPSSSFVYGANLDLDEDTLRDVANLPRFMRQSPFFNQRINYWGVAETLANRVGLALSSQEMENKYSSLSWEIVRRR